jgi:hypothetical protein
MHPRHYFRLNLLLFLAALLTGIAQQFLPLRLGRLGLALSAISVLVAVNYLWRRGSMSHSWWRSGTYLFFSAGIVAILAGMQDWPFAATLESWVLLAFPLYYLAWLLFGKRVRRLNDLLKLLWVWLSFPVAWAIRAHRLPVEWQFYLQYGCSLLLYYTYYDFVMTEREMQRILREHWDFDQPAPNKKDAP